MIPRWNLLMSQRYSFLLLLSHCWWSLPPPNGQASTTFSWYRMVGTSERRPVHSLATINHWDSWLVSEVILRSCHHPKTVGNFELFQSFFLGFAMTDVSRCRDVEMSWNPGFDDLLFNLNLQDQININHLTPCSHVGYVPPGSMNSSRPPVYLVPESW